MPRSHARSNVATALSLGGAAKNASEIVTGILGIPGTPYSVFRIRIPAYSGDTILNWLLGSNDFGFVILPEGIRLIRGVLTPLTLPAAVPSHFV